MELPLQADTRMRGYTRKARVNTPNPRPAASKSPNTTAPKSPAAANLQWLSIAEAREKETWEGYLPIPVHAEKIK